MSRYRKKPVVVEAVRNDGTWPPIIGWLDEISGGRFPVPFGTAPPIRRNSDGSLRIVTLEGTMTCDVGDYVIRGVKGEFYPVRSDIFEATYEAADA